MKRGSGKNKYCEEVSGFLRKYSCGLIFLVAVITLDWIYSKDDLIKFADNCNIFAIQYHHLFKAIGNLLPIVGIFISFGMFRIAQSNSADLQYRKDKDFMDRIRKNYEIVSLAMGRANRENKVDEDTFLKFLEAEQQAKLELPKDIEKFTDELYSFAAEAMAQPKLGLTELSLQKRYQATHLEKGFLRGKEAIKIYSKYLKIVK